MKIHNDNFSYSILLSINEGKSKGSGFRLKYRGHNFIISAKHVFYSNDNVLYGDILTVTCPSKPLGHGKLMLQIDLKKAKIYKSNTADVCILYLGKNIPINPNPVPLKNDRDEFKRPSYLEPENYVDIIEQTSNNIVSVDIEATRNLNEIGIANDLYLMGYPTSLGLQQSKYFDRDKPLIRKGIVSGINIKEETFIVDCPSYYGNSGGPVIEHGEDDFFRVIGVVSQYIPYETTWHNYREKIKNTEVANSGFTVCVPFDKIIELLDCSLPKINMRGKDSFTKLEIEKIKDLINIKLNSSPKEQTKIRSEIRNIGFFYSDFSSSKHGYTVADFEDIIKSGRITVI